MSSPSKRIWIALCLALCVACGRDAPSSHDEVASLGDLHRPHIVLVVIDTLRADALSPYGADAGSSPEIARWAEQGVVFERALAQSSWTKVSMASMMMSLWPRSHGVLGIRDAIAEGGTTLAETLSTAGYRTYGVQSNGWLEQTFGFHQGFEHYVIPRGNDQGWMGTGVWPHAENIYEEAGRLIDRHDPLEPMFLYLHFMDVHEYAAPTEFKRFGNDTLGAYRAAVRWVDAVLEKLREHLQRAGLLDRSVIILASDHAESFGENRSTGHARHVFTPVLHVPLILRLPFESDPIRVASQVRNIDLPPTILDIAGVSTPDFYEGESLLSLLATPGDRVDRPSFASLTDVLFKAARTQDAVSDGSWSFVRNLDAEGEEYLFDRSIDPDEDVNLVEIELEEAERLRPLLEAYRVRKPVADAVLSDVRIEPNLARKLEALGYMRE